MATTRKSKVSTMVLDAYKDIDDVYRVRTLREQSIIDDILRETSRDEWKFVSYVDWTSDDRASSTSFSTLFIKKEE